MEKKNRTLLAGLLLIFIFLINGSSGYAEALRINSEDYPSLSEKEIGHLRWIIELANQAPGDWSNMGQGGSLVRESAYKYQLGFMVYCLALAQYHKTPAYQEIYKQTMEKLLQKMLYIDVWGSWYEISKGGLKWTGELTESSGGWIDPVVEKNIMYSGHLLHMLGLYKMLYRDIKYDKPNSITFIWDRAVPIAKKKKFEYNHKSLAEVIHNQFIRNPLHVIECEPNAVFSECNQHPVLGLILYDHVNGTNLSAVKELVGKTYYDKKFIDPKTHHFMSFYRVREKNLVSHLTPSASTDGWSGAFMHAWDPNLIELHYPYQVKKYVKQFEDGTAYPNPFFAILAREVGDDKTADGILTWFDNKFASVWLNRMFRYPADDHTKFIPLADKLLAIARVNVKDGLWTLHNKPWKNDHFARPYISGVEYPKAIVKQAYYDPLKEALIVTILAGTDDISPASFAINNLDKSKLYSINKDGKTLGYLEKGALHLKSGVGGLELKSDGALVISTDLAKTHTFLIGVDR